MQPIILIADDHGVVRKGVKATLIHELKYTDIKDVKSCSGIMSELKKRTYTHLLLDINMGDGSTLEVIPNIRRAYPEVHIAVLTMLPLIRLQKAMKSNGIAYVISKTASDEDNKRMLAQFLQNEIPSNDDLQWDSDNPFLELTSREMEVLYYMLKGETTNAIGSILNLSKQAVSTYKGRIFEKTSTKKLKDLEALAEAFQIFSE
jgi:DNA-binding NarL/FixJ family response regulator